MRGILIKNKKGSWIKIIEAFLSLLLIASVFLIVINKGYIGKKDISNKVYDFQNAVLGEIQVCEECRNEIINPTLNADNSCKVDFDIKVEGAEFEDTLSILKTRTPDYLNCFMKICPLGKICEIKQTDTIDESTIKKDIFAEAVSITTDSSDENYCASQLKLFCWEK